MGVAQPGQRTCLGSKWSWVRIPPPIHTVVGKFYNKNVEVKMARNLHTWFNPHHVRANLKRKKTSDSTPGKSKGLTCQKRYPKMYLIQARTYRTDPQVYAQYSTVFSRK